MYGRKPRKLNVTAKLPEGTSAIIASSEAVEASRSRRKPRKQDLVAATIAISIVLAIVLSAILPFFAY